jgi:predicted deacylase
MKRTTEIDLPSPAPATRRILIAHRYGRSGARPKAYLQAALHADEAPGLLVMHHLQRRLDRAAAAGEIIGEVVLAPIANPIGLDQHINGHLAGRFDFGTGVNFNRNFPDLTPAVLARVEGRLAEDPEHNVALIRQALREAVAALPRVGDVEALKAALLSLSVDADITLDLHCDGEALMHLYASERQSELALELGRDMAAAVVLLEDEPGGGPFDQANSGPWWKLRTRLGDETAIPLACFGATVELRGEADVYDHLAEGDAAHLYRFLQRRGVIAGEPGAVAGPSPLAAPLDGVDVLKAPAAGIVAYRKALGASVEAGEVVAEIVDLTRADPTDARTPLRSETAGIFFARRADKLIRPGQSVCKVAGTRKLDHRQAGNLLEN